MTLKKIASHKERVVTYSFKCKNCGGWAANVISQRCPHCGAVMKAVREAQPVRGVFGKGVPKKGQWRLQVG